MAKTIYDVAKKAGVGIGTVSRAINNSPQIKPATKQKVLDAIQTLGYSPHSMAQRLAKRRTGIMATIMPFHTGHFYQALLRGIQQNLQKHSYDLLVQYVDKTNTQNRFLDSVLQEKRCDGVLMISMKVGDSYVKKFANTKLPLVLVDRAHSAVDSIHVENKKGAFQAVNYLVALGHRRIGMISGHRDNPPANRRSAGYNSALKKAGIEYRTEHDISADELSDDEKYHFNDGFNEDVGFVAMHKFLSMGENRPTAVFASADIQAIGAIKAAQAAGARIPDDISIIGFDDIELASYLSLTTMQQPMYEMGLLAVDLIMNKIEKKTTEIEQIKLSTKLVERGTTAPPKAPKDMGIFVLGGK